MSYDPRPFEKKGTITFSFSSSSSSSSFFFSFFLSLSFSFHPPTSPVVLSLFFFFSNFFFPIFLSFFSFSYLFSLSPNIFSCTTHSNKYHLILTTLSVRTPASTSLSFLLNSPRVTRSAATPSRPGIRASLCCVPSREDKSKIL